MTTTAKPTTTALALIEANKEIERLRAEVAAWRGCVMINAQMDGPKFMGFNRSEGRRVFDRYWGRTDEYDKDSSG